MGQFLGTFILKGTAIAGTLSNNNIGNSQFVRVVATAATITITVKESGGTTLGTAYLHGAGDEITLEKSPTNKITSATSKVTAVGSPRS
jgi:uncharacterized membrane protein YdfJ with MMPL/SSD domain